VFLTDFRGKKAVIYLHNINSLVLTTEKERVYCTVQTESLNIIHVTFMFTPHHTHT